MARLFVYGTLTERSQVETLLDRFDLGPEATLRGLHRVDGQYPTLAPGGEVNGRLLETPEIGRLDAYEGVESGLYVRVSVPAAGGDPAECYVGDPEQLGADAEWPGTGSFEERVRSYLAGYEVEIEPSE
jgi:gamma-glutamylaminecyclotransferase